MLMRQMLIQKNGSIYVFLTDEEQEINNEIEKENVEMPEVITKIAEMIYEDIFSSKKYQYPSFGGRYTFSFNQTVDDRPYKANQNYDIGLRVPVSYTHLDVYKRQGLPFPIRANSTSL